MPVARGGVTGVLAAAMAGRTDTEHFPPMEHEQTKPSVVILLNSPPASSAAVNFANLWR